MLRAGRSSLVRQDRPGTHWVCRVSKQSRVHHEQAVRGSAEVSPARGPFLDSELPVRTTVRALVTHSSHGCLGARAGTRHGYLSPRSRLVRSDASRGSAACGSDRAAARSSNHGSPTSDTTRRRSARQRSYECPVRASKLNWNSPSSGKSLRRLDGPLSASATHRRVLVFPKPRGRSLGGQILGESRHALLDKHRSVGFRARRVHRVDPGPNAGQNIRSSAIRGWRDVLRRGYKP